jgi:hypothetical protein
VKTIRRMVVALVLCGIVLCGIQTLAHGQEIAPVGPSAPGVSSPALPNLVSFNGTLKNSAGRPIQSITGVTFSLYAEEQGGGAPLWLETQNVTPDGTGRYTAQLGKNTSLPASLFASGEARWLGVRMGGDPEQPRVLLVAVPYAMKAADADTVGGLPASAFVLAAPATNGVPIASAASPSVALAASSATSSDVTTTGGTVNTLPLFTTATNVQNSVVTQTGSGSTAKIGINVAAPAATLDIKGGEYVRGTLTLPAIGNASATAGKNSQANLFISSAFNSSTGTPVNQKFQLQAEPINNNKASASGTLNLLYATGTNAPAETGLSINSKGQIAFAAGQTFPGVGTGTITSVGLTAPSSDFTVSGSPVTSSGTLALNWTVAPTGSTTANAIVKRDANGNFNGNVIGAATLEAADVYLSDSLSVGGSSLSPFQVSTSANNAIGVSGFVRGTTGASYGVYGQTNSSDLDAAGVYGITISSESAGVKGVQSFGSGTATGQSYSAGVWGDSQNGVGMLGTADDSNAVVGVNNSPTGYTTAYFDSKSTNGAAFVLYTNSASFGGHCSVDVKGNLACSGSTSALVPLDGGTRNVALSTIQSPQSWFEDFGSARLVNGVAVVHLDSDFIQTVNAEVDYKVFPVPDGDCKGLYVANKTATSFEVRELGGGTSNVSFDYRVTALRRNYENVRFADHTSDPVPFLKPAKVAVGSARPRRLPLRAIDPKPKN